jgi:hypothetical protein
MFDIYALEHNGRCELLDFIQALETSSGPELAKLIRLLDWTADSGKLRNPEKFKSLTDDIHEFKTHGGVRVLCFFDGRNIIVLTNGFIKKKNYGPEIERANNLKLTYLSTKRNQSLTYRDEII